MKKKLIIGLIVIIIAIIVWVIIWSRQPAKAKITKLSSPTPAGELLEKTEEMGKIFRWKYTSDWEIRVETNTEELAVVKLLAKSIGGDRLTLVVKKTNLPLEEDTGYILRIRRGDKKEAVDWKLGESTLFTREDGMERVLIGNSNGYQYSVAQMTTNNDFENERKLFEAVVGGIKIGPKEK